MIKKYISPFLNNYIQNQPTQNLQSTSNKMALKQKKKKKDKIELSKEEKNQMSHRKLALQDLLKKLEHHI